MELGRVDSLLWMARPPDVVDLVHRVEAQRVLARLVGAFGVQRAGIVGLFGKVGRLGAVGERVARYVSEREWVSRIEACGVRQAILQSAFLRATVTNRF